MAGSLKYLTQVEKNVVDRFVKLVRSEMGENLIDIELFGSKVRGNYSEFSDIDILVVVKDRTLNVMDKIAGITAELNIDYTLSISPVIFSEHEYRVNESMSSPFISNIEAEGIRL